MFSEISKNGNSYGDNITKGYRTHHCINYNDHNASITSYMKLSTENRIYYEGHNYKNSFTGYLLLILAENRRYMSYERTMFAVLRRVSAPTLLMTVWIGNVEKGVKETKLRRTIIYSNSIIILRLPFQRCDGCKIWRPRRIR